MKWLKSLFRWLASLLVLAAMATAIFMAFQPKPVAVDVVQVESGPMKVTVNEDGKTRIRERYVVSTPLVGRLLRVDVEPGDPVQRNGERIAVLTPRDPELLDSRELKQAEMRVKAREAALSRATPNVERAKAELEYAESDLGRIRKIAESRAVTRDEVDQAKREYRVAQQDYRSAVFSEVIVKYELELAKAALIRTQGGSDDLSDFNIFSPIDGCVLRVLQESATIVDAGTPLMEVGDPHDLEVVVDVLSTDAVKIRPGASAILERWGGDLPLMGKVRLVEPSAFTKISSLGVEEQRVNVIIDLVADASQEQTLGDGFRVEARIVIWEADDVLKLPNGALFREGDSWSVFLVQDDVALLRAVQIGKQNERETQVVAGLDAGVELILHPGDKIFDGTKIVRRQ